MQRRSGVPTWSARAGLRALVAGFVLVNALAFAGVGLALRQSWSHHRERAVVATQNLTAALEQYLGGLIDKIDLGLLAVSDEYVDQVAAGHVDLPALGDFAARQQLRIPEVSAIRIADARGDVVGGSGVRPGVQTNVSEYGPFPRLRADPGAGLVISEPLVGRVDGTPEIILGRPLGAPGGAFGGVAAATIPLADISSAFARFDVGRRGAIILRDANLGLVVRRSEGAPVALGSRTVSPELQAFVREGRTSATYSGIPVDGVERTFTFRKVSKYPLYVIVGLAFDDYLGEWRREAIVAVFFLAIFTMLTGVAAAFGYRSWRRREAAVEALAAQETKFRLVAESATDLIWIVAPALRFTYVSPAVERLLGYTVEEAMALPLERLYTPAYLERISALARRGVTADPFSQPFAGILLEQELVRKDGRVLHAEAHFNILWTADGQIIGALGISRDVTERRELQARIQSAERMASLGTLAAGVAHEVNNPLTYVLTNVAYALERLREPERGEDGAPVRDAVQALAEALAGAESVRDIVRDLKTFSRADGERLAPVDPNAVVEGCLKMTASLTSARATVTRRLGEVPAVYATEARLAQVILNLVVNAAHAIPEGRPRDHRIEVATSLAQDGRVVVEVADTGTGIAADVLPRIFEPFFTTKPVGEGTGLGLSICHGIVKALGGDIQVETAPGKGSIFRVMLPPAPVSGARRSERAETPPPRPRTRVLVLDDDPLVARAVARMVGERCAVDVVTDPAAALARVAGGERWDLVLCDLMMPGLSGMEVHARIQAIDPGLAARMVFMTGGAFTPEAQGFLTQVPNARLEKPIDREALAAVLEPRRSAA